MTEEMKTCDFYNKKICTLFSKYFDFNVECENLFLSTIDCDIERECPIKHLEQENKELKEMLSKEPKAMQAFQIAYSGLKKDNEVLWEMVKDYKTALEEINITVKQLLQGVSSNCINNTPYLTALSLIENKINEVLE